jgi:hypothetical protein
VSGSVSIVVSHMPLDKRTLLSNKGKAGLSDGCFAQNSKSIYLILKIMFKFDVGKVRNRNE